MTFHGTVKNENGTYYETPVRIHEYTKTKRRHHNVFVVKRPARPPRYITIIHNDLTVPISRPQKKKGFSLCSLCVDKKRKKEWFDLMMMMMKLLLYLLHDLHIHDGLFCFEDTLLLRVHT